MPFEIRISVAGDDMVSATRIDKSWRSHRPGIRERGLQADRTTKARQIEACKFAHSLKTQAERADKKYELCFHGLRFSIIYINVILAIILYTLNRNFRAFCTILYFCINDRTFIFRFTL